MNDGVIVAIQYMSNSHYDSDICHFKRLGDLDVSHLSGMIFTFKDQMLQRLSYCGVRADVDVLLKNEGVG